MCAGYIFQTTGIVRGGKLKIFTLVSLPCSNNKTAAGSCQQKTCLRNCDTVRTICGSDFRAHFSTNCLFLLRLHCHQAHYSQYTPVQPAPSKKHESVTTWRPLALSLYHESREAREPAAIFHTDVTHWKYNGEPRRTNVPLSGSHLPEVTGFWSVYE